MPTPGNITGRDGSVMTEALAFAYAAMRYLPVLQRSESNREDMRALLFAWAGDAERVLGQAMLTAWHLTHDTKAGARDEGAFRENMLAMREEAILELDASIDDATEREDLQIMIRYIEQLLGAPRVELAKRGFKPRAPR